MKYRKFYELAAKFEKPPGYSCYPIVGHAHHYANLEGKCRDKILLYNIKLIILLFLKYK